MGKTALAVHWAHTVADWFPDGQLYLNLRGYANAAPLRPIEALAAMLRSLGTPPDQIPVDEEQAAALYRTRLADRRVLVVLDNAGSAGQVRSLLPGSPTCLVLVTSRNRLDGLVGRDGARRLTLDVLSVEEARALLTYLLGGQGVLAEPDAVDELAAACGFLPLALRIAAAGIIDRPAQTVAGYAAQLRDGDRLQILQAYGDQESSIRAALDLSYRTLPSETARLFRLLGLHPGHDIEPYAAAALAGLPPAQIAPALDRLVAGHLLQMTGDGRYVFHDLVRAYAVHRATTGETEADRQAALTRLLTHYQHTAVTAMDSVHPYAHERRIRVPPADTATPNLPDAGAATGWLDAELPNLVATARLAAGTGRHEYICSLSRILHRHLLSRDRYLDAETLHQAALTSARTSSNRADELSALLGLGDIYLRQARYGEALDQHQRALAIARRIRDRTGELGALTSLGHLHHLRAHHDEAIHHYQQALAIARAIGHRIGERKAHTSLGYALWVLGRHDEAIHHYSQALEMARVIGDRTGELGALRGLGDVHWVKGRYEQAIDHLEQALEIARTSGDRAGELGALIGLGHIHRRQGQWARAGYRYRLTLAIARTINSGNWQFEALQGLGRLRQATGHPPAALLHHAGALRLANDLGQPADQARAHDGLAHAYRALNQYAQARHHWRAALGTLTAIGTDHTEEAETNTATIGAHLDRLADGSKEQAM